jgi:hypothetical protein
MGNPVAARELHKAQPVAMRIKAHRFAIDSDDGTKVQSIRQIARMKVDHEVPLFATR